MSDAQSLAAGDLRDSAGDWSAGDLSPAEHAAFAALLESEPGLRDEVHFWQQLREQLPTALRPETAHPPGPDLAQALRRRLAEPAPGARFSWWSNAGWALAAALLLAVLLPRQQATAPSESGPFAFTEDGAALYLPEQESGNDLQLQRVTMIQVDGPAPQPAELRERPWLGVVTRPVDLRGFSQDKGLQVVRLSSSGPAAKAGLLPGDVLLQFGDCPMRSRWCISRALHDGQLRAGDPTPLVYLRPHTGAVLTTEIILGVELEQ